VYVRWKSRSTGAATEHAWSLVLVRSERVDGKPRQRVVKYLGSIRDSEMEQPPAVTRFWQRVDAQLDELRHAGTLTGREREDIERKLRGEVDPSRS